MERLDEVNLKDAIKKDECTFICYKTEPGNSTAPIIDMDPVTIKKRFMKIL